MAVTLTAVNCPPPQAPGAPKYMADQNSTSGSPATSLSFTSGNLGAQVSGKLNRNFTGQDMQSIYGAGGYAVGFGLGVSAGTGLQATVDNGQATVHGVVEIKQATAPAVVVGATATTRVWLKQDGTLEAIVGSTTPPATNAVFLGAAMANASAVTAVDTSGVVYWKGGNLWRETADTAAPGDTPSTTLRLFTKTTRGTYFWDGVSHRLFDGAEVLDPDVFVKQTIGTASVYHEIGPPITPQGGTWTGWTTRGAAFTTEDVYGQIATLSKAAGAGVNVSAKVISLPNSGIDDFDIKFWLMPEFFNYTAQEVGILLHETATGKALGWGIVRGPGFFTGKYNSVTSYSATYLFREFYFPHKLGLRITKVGTNYTFYYSFNGVLWHQYDQRTLTDFLTTRADEVGVFLNPNNATMKVGLTLMGVDKSW